MKVGVSWPEGLAVFGKGQRAGIIRNILECAREHIAVVQLFPPPQWQLSTQTQSLTSPLPPPTMLQLAMYLKGSKQGTVPSAQSTNAASQSDAGVFENDMLDDVIRAAMFLMSLLTPGSA